MKDGDQFWIPPHPQPAADRTASDLAEARLARRMETRLRIIERMAPSVFNAIKASPDSADHVMSCAEYVVDQLEAIVEPCATEK